jgi:hypothetical protein
MGDAIDDVMEVRGHRKCLALVKPIALRTGRRRDRRRGKRQDPQGGPRRDWRQRGAAGVWPSISTARSSDRSRSSAVRRRQPSVPVWQNLDNESPSARAQQAGASSQILPNRAPPTSRPCKRDSTTSVKTESPPSPCKSTRLQPPCIHRVPSLSLPHPGHAIAQDGSAVRLELTSMLCRYTRVPA